MRVIRGLTAKFNRHIVMHVFLYLANLNIQAKEEAKESTERDASQTAYKQWIDFSFTSSHTHNIISKYPSRQIFSQIVGFVLSEVNVNRNKSDAYWIRAFLLKVTAANKCLLQMVSFMLFKQQVKALTKINLFLIYTVNTMQCYFRLNYFISAPEYYW